MAQGKMSFLEFSQTVDEILFTNIGKAQLYSRAQA
jgi:hypothetical protein